jgi:rRNA maturation protein Nop10
MDPKYIQEVIRGEFFPMARKCYEELLSRKKTAAGRIEMSFSIVADEKLGAIIEDVEADHGDSGIADDKMTTCMRESLSTVSFRPPAHGGIVTVVYPIVFSPDDEHDGG